MGLFDKSREELERENKMLKERLARQSAGRTQQKKVLYQCRYCSYKSVRNVAEGAPLPGITWNGTGLDLVKKSPNCADKGMHGQT